MVFQKGCFKTNTAIITVDGMNVKVRHFQGEGRASDLWSAMRSRVIRAEQCRPEARGGG